MPFNGAGVFVRVYNWVTDAANGVFVRADRMDGETDGIATGLSNCITRDGQSPATANIPMGSFKLTGLAAATATGDALSMNQTGAALAGTATLVNLTTTGNNILGDAQADTLNVGNGDIVKDASGNTGFGVATVLARVHVLSGGTANTTYTGAPAVIVEGTNKPFYPGGDNAGNITVASNSAIAADSGGSISFASKYTGNLVSEYSKIKGGKDDGVAGNFTGYLAFGTQSGGGITERLRITSDGRLYGTALHNNAGAVTGTANQYIASGTYTPTISGTTNVASSTGRLSQWLRVGNVVTVSGTVTITPTAAASTLTILNLSLPIASTLSTYSVAGVGARVSSAAPDVATVGANSSTALVNFAATNTSGGDLAFTFTYVVL